MESGREPSAQSFGPSEVDVMLLTNGVSWYLKSRLVADYQQLTVTTPRTILGLIPIGKLTVVVDLQDLTRVTIGTKLNPDRMLVAIVLGVTATLGGLGVMGTLLAGLGAVAFLLLGFIAVVRIEKRSQVTTVPVCLAHLRRARRFIADLELRSIAAHQAGSGRSS